MRNCLALFVNTYTHFECVGDFKLRHLALWACGIQEHKVTYTWWLLLDNMQSFANARSVRSTDGYILGSGKVVPSTITQECICLVIVCVIRYFLGTVGSLPNM